MNKIYDIMLIGGGASNLISSTYLANKIKSEDFILVEKLNRVGKKLISTGNGQGNLTNSFLSEKNYYSEKQGFYSYAINSFDNNELEKYLNGIGIYLTERDGKKYPVSFEASSVLDLIRENLSYKKVNIKTDCEIKSIIKRDSVFIAESIRKEKFYSYNIILGCGGCAGKQYGTDGSAYKLAQNFGHTLTKLYPSLVQIKTDTKYIKGLKGIKSVAKCRAVVNNVVIKEERGEVLFTDYGVSGSAVFQLSGHLLKENESYIEIEFLPDMSEKEIIDILSKKTEKSPYLKGENILNGLINKQISKEIIKYANSNRIEDIVKAIKNFKLKVTGSLGFNYAQVTKGGINVKDIDERTMESKLIKGLYIVGEMLDVDGDCGGYNLQWAFSSGITASRSIVKKLYDKNR